MAKIKYGILIAVTVLIISFVNDRPVLADQTTSNVGIAFTGHWQQPGQKLVPPTGDTQSPKDGNHLTVVSEVRPSVTSGVTKLPQTGVKQDLQQIQLLGSSLLIIGIGILIRKRDGIQDDK